MELYDLTVFLAVVETGGFTQAAKKLHCVQPNVTARIKKLETSLGTQLFYRENRGVTLTTHGRELIGQAKQIIRLASDTETRFQREEVTGQLNVGVSQTAATAWLPKILQPFMEQYPQVDINVQSLFVESMTTKLLNHELDCAISDIAIAHPNVHYVYSRPERLMVTHAKSYQLTTKTKITTLNFSRASHYRRILYDYLEKEELPVAREITLKGMDAVLACVLGGVGVSLLPESVVNLHYIAPHVEAVALDGVAGKVGILTHTNNVETAALSAFMDLARQNTDC